jgi:hypothetical protein
MLKDYSMANGNKEELLDLMDSHTIYLHVEVTNTTCSESMMLMATSILVTTSSTTLSAGIAPLTLPLITLSLVPSLILHPHLSALDGALA